MNYTDIIIDIMKELKGNEELKSANWGNINKETLIYGEGAPLDSLDFVRLVMEIEERVLDETDTSITIINEKAFSKKHNPFKTPERLAEYIKEVIENEESE